MITNLFGTRMNDAYLGGFTVNQNAAANRIACNAQNSTTPSRFNQPLASTINS